MAKFRYNSLDVVIWVPQLILTVAAFTNKHKKYYLPSWTIKFNYVTLFFYRYGETNKKKKCTSIWMQKPHREVNSRQVQAYLLTSVPKVQTISETERAVYAIYLKHISDTN